jgi:hypothetical protein
MKRSKVFLCEGFCHLTGQIRDLIPAAGFGEAKTKFYLKHRVQATHVCLER